MDQSQFPVPLGPPPLAKGMPAKRRVAPWILLGSMILVSLIGLVSGFGGFLLIFGLLLTLVSLAVIIFGRGGWAWMRSRTSGLLGLLAALGLIIGGTAMTGPGNRIDSTPVEALSANSPSLAEQVTSTAPPTVTPTPTASATPSAIPTTKAAVEPTVPVPTVEEPQVVPTQAPAPQPQVRKPVVPQLPAPKPFVKPVPAPQPTVVPAPAEVYYPNCAAARKAGAAPLYIGQPGYRPKLDGDHDGIACE